VNYFPENNPEYSIFAVSSLLGVANHHGVSFPVGKVRFLTLQPLNFHEFLFAMGKIDLVHALQKIDTVRIEIFHVQYKELLKQYYFLGGMPEALNQFAEHKDYH